MNPPGLFLKACRALLELPKTLRTTPRPRLIMTLLVKNEAQMLAHNLEFHHKMGVDGFIITDNNSTDETPDIIAHYQKRGWILETIHETATDYEQKQWVDRMVWLAKVRYRADWIINADADEFWYTPSLSLKDEMDHTRANVLACEMRSVYPEDGREWTEWTRTVRYVADYEAYGLSLYSIFERQNKKVAHRAAGYLQISMGNHKVKMLPQHELKSHIVVYHYNVRGREQFMAKMINGGKQLEQHKGRHGGRHWRYFYALYKEGRLEEEYNRVIGLSSLGKLTRDGYVFNDNPLPALFKEMNSGSDLKP